MTIHGQKSANMQVNTPQSLPGMLTKQQISVLHAISEHPLMLRHTILLLGCIWLAWDQFPFIHIWKRLLLFVLVLIFEILKHCSKIEHSITPHESYIWICFFECSPQHKPNEYHFDWWERIICPIWRCLFLELALTINAHSGIHIFLPVGDFQHWAILWRRKTWKNDYTWENDSPHTSFYCALLAQWKNEWLHHWDIQEVVIFS